MRNIKALLFLITIFFMILVTGCSNNKTFTDEDYNYDIGYIDSHMDKIESIFVNNLKSSSPERCLLWIVDNKRNLSNNVKTNLGKDVINKTFDVYSEILVTLNNKGLVGESSSISTVSFNDNKKYVKDHDDLLKSKQALYNKKDNN